MSLPGLAPPSGGIRLASPPSACPDPVPSGTPEENNNYDRKQTNEHRSTHTTELNTEAHMVYASKFSLVPSYLLHEPPTLVCPIWKNLDGKKASRMLRQPCLASSSVACAGCGRASASFPAVEASTSCRWRSSNLS